MDDRLKKIRDKQGCIQMDDLDNCLYYPEDGVAQIQSETYQLGRDEVIEEIEKWVSDKKMFDAETIWIGSIKSRLTQLKEQKK